MTFHPTTTALALLLAGSCPAWLGVSTADAQVPGRPIRFLLLDDSTYEVGCQPPCMCPVVAVNPVLGTMVFTRTASNPLFDTYTVSNVRWHMPLGPEGAAVTGSGTYIVGGEVAVTQHLTLELDVTGEPTRKYDSGTVVGGFQFPQQLAVSIAINGFYCYDQIFRLHAESVLPCNIADICEIGGGPAGDGLLTGDDFVAFINAFVQDDPLADIAAIGGAPEPDGLVTGDDFVAFINAFAHGCF